MPVQSLLDVLMARATSKISLTSLLYLPLKPHPALPICFHPPHILKSCSCATAGSMQERLTAAALPTTTATNSHLDVGINFTCIVTSCHKTAHGKDTPAIYYPQLPAQKLDSPTQATCILSIAENSCIKHPIFRFSVNSILPSATCKSTLRSRSTSCRSCL